MPPRSRVSRLPADVLSELNERLRAASYGGYVEISRWLRGKGYAISKSPLTEYGAALREADCNPLQGLTKRDQLMLELGRVRFREAAILDEIRALDSDA